MNPIEIADKIQKVLGEQANYLRPVGEHCPQLADKISRYPFCKALYVERIAKYRQSSHTLGDLKEEGILEEETAEAFARFFGKGKESSNFHPYIHQENAIRDTRNGKNLIVCTGTGSGKTESFLMPVIDGIVRERKEKGKRYEEEKGIRAIILYPMNALVNDQVARIRKLISKARINDIKYVKDISFGIYTGDLKEKELEPVCLDVKEGECGCAKHRLFTHEETPPTEYVSRERWKGKPADILITNYVMLERLLLSPDGEGMFKKRTLKYIILDEAHSYDGSCGTDIAWLVRRLVERFRCNGAIGGESDQTLNVQYIATTATLVDQSESDREKVIKEEFASKLFPARPESFSVQFGEEEPDNYKQDDISDEHTETVTKSLDYAGIVNRSLENEDFLQEYVKDIKEWKESSDNQEDNCTSAICDIMMPPQEGKATLMQATQWLCSVQQWLNEWNFLVEEENHLANINELKQPVGDAMFLAEALLKLDPSFRLQPNKGHMKNLCDCYKKCADTYKKKVEDIISLYVSEREQDDTKKALKEWCENTEDNKKISARNFIILLQTIISLTEISDGREKADILLEWDKEFISTLEELKGKLDDARKKINDLEGKLRHVWRHELKEDGDSSIETIVTDALKKRGELDRCAKFLRDRKDSALIDICNRGEEGTIEKSVFPAQEEADQKKNFDAFAQLLTLTRESGQPLMNLRFHLLTTGISGIAVYFEKNEKGEAKPHFVFDYDLHFEDETYYERKEKHALFTPGASGARACTNYEGEEKHALFTLSICPSCGFPFVGGFVRDGHISRYPYSGKEKKKGDWMYFSWLEDGDYKEKIRLDIQTGECNEGAAMPKEGYVELYKLEKKDKVYICPKCARLLKNQGDDEEIISPYDSNASKDRIRILTELVKSSDPSINARNVIAGGRKVLAFSDSRSGAARLALDLDSFVEESLLKQMLVAILRKQDHMGEAEIKFRLGNKDSKNSEPFGNAFIDKFSKSSNEAEDGKKLLERLKRKISDADDVFEKLSEAISLEKEKEKKTYDFSHSLLALLSPLHEEIKKKGAEPLLDREWDGKDRERYFGSFASLSLLALGVLRSNRRHSVTGDKLKLVKIYSHAQDSPNKGGAQNKWNEYINDFLNEEAACKFFNFVYERIFRTAELYCGEYDTGNGDKYAEETDQLLNGYGYDQRYLKKRYTCEKKNEDFLSFIGANGSKTKVREELEKEGKLKDDVEIDDVLKNLWNFMVEAHILCCPHDDNGYLLNLDDIRIKKGENLLENKSNQFIPEPLDQYYRVEEHTAQLETEKARCYQDLFSTGRINVLSCSTTFEMGVDLGDLNCIFLSNMPPTVANYKQRAGRAGRRVGSASFVVTYMRRDRNHDEYYSNRPEDLLFGQVKRPMIYVDEDVSLRAKHFRAEALADFLRYVSERESKMTSWRKCEVYFEGQKDEDTDQSYNLIERYIDAWCEENGGKLQEHCQKICGGERIEIMGSEYKVAEDLRCQLLGEADGNAKIFKKPTNYRWLSGPYLPNDAFNPCVRERYEKVKKEVKKYKDIEDIGETDFISYLSKNRVLPRYGFSCDEIALYPIKKRNLDLSRDVQHGLFDYAPGQTVIADKRTFQSLRPLSYKEVGGKKKDTELREDGFAQENNIKYCDAHDDNVRYYFKAKSKCPECDQDGKEQKVIVPDAFLATGGSKVRGFIPQKRVPRNIAYPGGIDEEKGLSVSDHCRVYCSDVRALWYINDRCEWAEKKNGPKEKYTLLREVSTDVLLIGKENASPGVDSRDKAGLPEKYRWESALAAILKATAEVLNVSLRDVEGLVTKINKKFYIVIYDASPSGSGIILPILPDNSSDSERNERKKKKILEILKKAREICTGCSCYKSTENEADKKVYSHDKYLHLREEKKQGREARSCYDCLKSYSNQRMHPYLDAREAARLIEELIGGEKDDGAPAGLPTTAQAEFLQPAAAQETSEPSELQPEAPQSPDVPEASQGCELTEDDLNRIRHGMVARGTKYKIRYEGKEIEVSYVNALGNGQQADRIVAEENGVPLPRPILISDILKRL